MYHSFHPGREWLDTEGKPIQAHGGSVIYVKDRYYWYGENKEKTDVYTPVFFCCDSLSFVFIVEYSQEGLTFSFAAASR